MTAVETETITTAIPTGTWESDPVHSSFDFAVKHNAVGTFRGSVRQFEASLVGGKDASLQGVARVENLDVKDEALAGHLLAPDFFDAERYPEVRFASESIRVDDGQIVVEGQLGIKGTRQPVTLTGEINGTPVEDAYGNDRIGLELTGTIDRTAFGLEWNAPLPNGENILGDDVTLTAALSLIRATA